MIGLSRPRSVRAYLLAWIIFPIAVFIVLDTLSLYRNALESANKAYDRMLIASAHSIGDLLKIEDGRMIVTLPHAALEIYQADRGSHMVFRVSGPGGEFLSGYEDLPNYTGAPRPHAVYPDLVDMYEDEYKGEPVRIAALYQPVASNTERGIALIQVAESLENRREAARRILRETLLHQAVLVAAVVLVTLLVVSRALRPLEALRAQLDQRRADDLSDVAAPYAPRELQPVVGALNELMERLRRSREQQKRFIAQASHQLRTPLAVLKTQLQSGLRGDAPAQTMMREMSGTVERATALANQLLSLARVDQLREHSVQEDHDLASQARDAAVKLSPLISEKNLDFELDVAYAPVRGHPWMTGELVSNLLHNAIRHTPPESRLGIRVRIGAQAREVCLSVWDSGPGLPPERRAHLFEPFAGEPSALSIGLGLTICREIVDSMDGTIAVENRGADGAAIGLEVTVRLPAAAPSEPGAA